MVKEINKQAVFIIVILLAIIGFLVYWSSFSEPGNEGAAVKSVQDAYQLMTENPVEILKVTEESGLYKVTMKTRLQNGQQSVAEAYVTKNGKLLATVVNATDYLKALQKQKSFDECLAGKNLLVAGQSTDLNTIQQLSLLGNYAYKFYVDCVGNNLQLCQNAGVKEIPVTVYENYSYTGIKPVQFYENLTGCTY